MNTMESLGSESLRSHLPWPRVAVIGAGRVGSTLAQRLVENQIADVVLLDVVEGLPQGIALDLMQAQGLEGHGCTLIGTNDYGDTQNADVVVITAGFPRRPGMDRDDLLSSNTQIVTTAAKAAIAQSPNALLLVITNPLDVMTYAAWHATQLPPQRVIGMAGMLDSARLQQFIAQALNVASCDVQTLVLGGHGDLMLPLARYCTVRGVPLTELLPSDRIQTLIERTRHGGAELVKLYQTGSAFYAPASAAALMVKAIAQPTPHLMPASAYLDGEYGIRDLFVGVPCWLNHTGITQILELDLTEAELLALQASAVAIRNNVKQILHHIP
ncbi:malate dehydrogenase [Spirulina major]|uniref:malate dehydrogenase n=1 Tax=Spirulina major TaxID=270636 RepID=UPI0009321717|nr:malate dehydrogenase [Spirulina major]